MARRRDTTIKEDLKDLQQLEDKYRGRPEMARLTVLRLLKSEPEYSIGEVAVLTGYSVPTVKRWLKSYRDDGLDALLQMTPRGRREGEHNTAVSQLSKKLATGELRSLEDVRQWIDLHHHASPARKAPDHATMIPGAQPRKGLATGKNAAAEGNGNHVAMTQALSLSKGPSTAAEPISERALKFLCSLPTTHKTREWIVEFRKAFQEFLGDVDHVNCIITVLCNIITPEEGNIFPLSVIKPWAGNPSPQIALTHSPDDEDAGHLERFAAALRSRNFPFKDYHPPTQYVLYYRDIAYLGVIVLWRKKGKPPISAETVALVERMRPFLEFLFSDIVARHQVSSPAESVLNLVLKEVTDSTKLTMQENRVLALQLLGYSYEDMAEVLSISKNTVRTHVKSIYVKTGAHGPAQFFAKYFTPLVTRSWDKKP